MGEDFLRRKNDRCQRLADARFMELREPGLFYGVRPEARPEVYALLRPGAVLEIDSELWAPSINPDGSITFRLGQEPVADVAASDAKALGNEARANLVAYVAELDRDAGVVALRVQVLGKAALWDA